MFAICIGISSAKSRAFACESLIVNDNMEMVSMSPVTRYGKFITVLYHITGKCLTNIEGRNEQVDSDCTRGISYTTDC